MGILSELFSSAVDDGELLYDVGLQAMPQQAGPMDQQPAINFDSEIKKSMASRDGDGDGMIDDGTDQERPYNPMIDPSPATTGLEFKRIREAFLARWGSLPQSSDKSEIPQGYKQVGVWIKQNEIDVDEAIDNLKRLSSDEGYRESIDFMVESALSQASGNASKQAVRLSAAMQSAISEIQHGAYITSGGASVSGYVEESLSSVANGIVRGAVEQASKKVMEESSEYKYNNPARPSEIEVFSVDPKTIKIDPARFQYKVVGIGEGGVGSELKDTKVWKPILGGVLLVWRDPETKEDYVVNGHHRLELAKRTGVDTINVRYVDAPTAKAARGLGALANIAEGRGTAVDAAKFLRDTDTMVDDFVRKGVSLRGKIAADAVQLTKLSEKAFQKVSTGTMDESKAVAIARFLSEHDLQDKLIKRLEDREENGQEWTIKEIETASRKMANAGRLKTQGVDLFGEFESEESTFDQEVEIESYVRRQLSQEIADFSAVASQRRADRVADAGNVLAVDENLQRAKSAEVLLDAFDRETGLRGPISDAIKRLAGEFVGIKSKAKKTEFKSKAFDELKQLLREGESRV